MFGVGKIKKLKRKTFFKTFIQQWLHSKRIQFKSSDSKDFLIVTKHFYFE